MFFEKVRSRLNNQRARVEGMPLRSRRPRPTPRAIQRMAERHSVYSPDEVAIIDARAIAYDAVWGFCADSEFAAFLDFERVRVMRENPKVQAGGTL